MQRESLKPFELKIESGKWKVEGYGTFSLTQKRPQQRPQAASNQIGQRLICT